MMYDVDIELNYLPCLIYILASVMNRYILWYCFLVLYCLLVFYYLHL